MTAYALSLSAVARAFRRGRGRRAQALEGVSLALLAGEIAGVVGPPGSGKSTLLRVAAGIVTPDAGEARICGVRAADPAARRLAGYAPEAAVFPAALTAREALAYYARFHAAGAARRGLVHDALDAAGLGPAADRRIADLGRADVQRLALAQAALGGRRVLLLDEPLAGLDPVGRRDLGARLAGLAAAGVAILLAARDVAALERIAGRVVVLRAGRVVRAGAVSSLLGERVLEVFLDAPPADPPPGFRVTAAGVETPLVGRTAEAALALCRMHRLPVRASRVRVKSLEEIVLDAHDAAR